MGYREKHMKKLILSLVVVAFAVAVQAGGEGCAVKAANGTCPMAGKADAKMQCAADSKQGCCAQKQTVSAKAKEACCAEGKQACSADGKQACSADAKDKAQCAMAKTSCCGKVMKQVKQPLRSPKDA